MPGQRIDMTRRIQALVSNRRVEIEDIQNVHCLTARKWAKEHSTCLSVQFGPPADDDEAVWIYMC